MRASRCNLLGRTRRNTRRYRISSSPTMAMASIRTARIPYRRKVLRAPPHRARMICWRSTKKRSHSGASGLTLGAGANLAGATLLCTAEESSSASGESAWLSGRTRR
eukprot:scaffold3221_cov118-Isochrysis_galbana.AAC.10